MWKQGGRSTALERAQAALSSRRGRGTPATATAHSTPRASAQELPTELLSSHSGSSLSSAPVHTDQRPGITFVSYPKNEQAPEVARPLTSLDLGANRFLKKKTPAAVQDQPIERTLSSSLKRGSQTAVLSRLAEIENRIGKGVQKKSPPKAEQMAVGNIPEEQIVLAHPSSAQPRRFVKNRPQNALRGDGLLGQFDSSEHSAQVHNIRQQLHSPAHLSTASPRTSSPVQAYTPPELSASLPSSSPSSPSPPDLPPSLPDMSPSPPDMSHSAGSILGDVRSLEELFPVDEASEDISEHFQMNVLDIDELGPSTLQQEEDPGEKEVQESLPEDSQEAPGEEEYQSDFESVIQTESLSEPIQDRSQLSSPLHSVHTQDRSQLSSPVHSVHTQDSAQSPSTVHSVHTQDSVQSPSPVHSVHTQDSAQSPSPVHSVHTQDSAQSPSPVHSESSYSKSSTSATSEAHSPEAPVSDSRLPHSQMPSAKFKSGQTSHQHAHCIYSPSLELLMESLRQQLTLTSQFISRSREHHTRVLENLGPPNYTYTTLEDTQEYIWKQRASRPCSKKLTGKR